MFVPICLSLLVLAGDGPPAKTTPSLAKLQQAYAMDYFDPQHHIALAKYHHDRGNRLLAFYILESARRGRFPAKVFDPAFSMHFRGVKPFDNSKDAENALLAKHEKQPHDPETLFALADIFISRDDWPNARNYLTKLIAVKPEAYENYEALAEVYRQEKDAKKAQDIVDGYFTKYPESVEAYERKIGPLMRKEPAKAKLRLEEAQKKHPKHAPFVFNSAILLQDAEKLDVAEKLFLKAAELGPDNAHIQGWVGRFYLRTRMNDENALKYYLNVYFLDPHFRDTEFAEGRIRKLNYTTAKAVVAKSEKEGQPLDALLKHENPVVVGLALDKLGHSKVAKARQQLLDALGHDDPTIRIQAVDLLTKHHGDSLGKEISVLLASEDLRVRGLACYLAVKLQPEKGLELVRPLLQDKSQLVRFDALSAFVLEGGEKGKQIVRDHRKLEQNPQLQQLIDSLDKK